MTDRAAEPFFDVLIVGAGLSGIGAAWHLQRGCPGKTYAILEARAALGGTWDLFRYPGVRSDSDMYTLGYAFQPWTEGKAIADGPAIRRYIARTARDNGIDRHIRYGHRVIGAHWSSEDACWRVEAEHDGLRVWLRTRFLYMCSGYYSYDEAYRPRFDGEDDFAGRIVQPQFWPAELDYRGRRVVVVGSGATAVTLVPAMAKDAAHVTMLQRSPTYIVSRPSEYGFAQRLRRWLPARAAYALTRWRVIVESMLLYRLARSQPDLAKRKIVEMARHQLGPGYDVDTHFTPAYKPWDQRVCVVPDGDLFRAIRSGRASVATDRIAKFTPEGLLLDSGRVLPAEGRGHQLGDGPERLVLTKDGLLEGAKLRVRLEAELLAQQASERAVGFERVGMATRAVERDHELRAQTLVERMEADERLELSHGLCLAPDSEHRLEASLERPKPEVFETGDLRLRERLGGETGECRPAPE